MELAAPGIGQQLVGKLRRTGGGHLDLVEAALHGGLKVRIHQGQTRMTHDAHEQVVEVMGDAARQHPEALQLLGLLDLGLHVLPVLLGLAPLGHVAGVHHDAVDARNVQGVVRDGLHEPGAAVLVEHPDLKGLGAAGGPAQLQEGLLEERPVSGMDQVDRRGAQPLAGLIPQDPPGGRTAVDHLTRAVEDHHKVERVLDDGPQPGLAGLELLLHAVPVEGHLHGGVEGPLVKGLQEVAVGATLLGPGQGLLVGEGREEDHRNAQVLEVTGRIDPVHARAQGDVHEHKVRGQPGGGFQCLLARGGQIHRTVAQLLEMQL